ncbi:MAG: bifunctional 23S rRNA (guanine(2069)-N(7))-methyltransferase RlmK/23S rRNA (guanine(2445)-N(2))-methyltransferase RlmL [Porticoccus sp.]|uniref:bifunctional 23S rRNA (guanine(2069)-N(7))-methyltransferase RlmK/23S rRNA (guanine(2445)-N(2))-methyltransferase RlmL n=1 Tax=Porticoccus hydrocarbonoclasticus TaxID=1073414 RepID=UPI00055F8C1E|nr:bifunctional 23S rRNA (guanine(2069)-N(7))-methyltransferase RlmK/23S rRNA (guanine(2445)-N(2))-methyltransferase RlmL [Porticoccus hydrocarbonoclasticus]MBG57047.1 bifunctional 23S rRNA (guanine(2069)-N(7))-methyltransferase RlmK/23S rRNA (guanine(2445)-N(2))-methyltransferase RlmL [Porticoccus sp.]
MSMWFASCPKGLESLLASELTSLGAGKTRETVAGVYVEGTLAFAYRACLWSRLANRVLLPLEKFDVSSADDLYRGVRSIPWETHLTPRQSIAVDFIGTNDAIRHTKFGAQQVKDAIVDQLQDYFGERPDVDLQNPDLRINVRLAKDAVTVSLDMSGGSLHKRGYRVAMVPAPLKENLAAALLLRAGWPEIAARGGALIDPLCGSGTFLIEGAMMVADMAPGLIRERFGFHGWAKHDDTLWQDIRQEALARCEAGLSREIPEIRGYDKDTRAVSAAQENIACAGLEKWVRVMAKPIEAFKKPTHRETGDGLIICNPPYGERWGEMEELKPLYQTLGEVAKRECPGWRMAVITGNAELAGELRLRADKKYQFFNGTIPSQLLLFQLREADDRNPQPRSDESAAALGEGAQMFANRLKKNARKLAGWLKASGVSCYRLYDADMPEYAVAIDVYQDAIHVQEYAPPITVDEASANRHLTEIRQALLSLYPESRGKLFFKERRRQKGDSQYQRQPSGSSHNALQVVTEGAARFEVNLSDYLDTGLFLDHRPVRRMIGAMARGKRVLNLFCYTAAASVHAALGGATSSLSIDMSNSYLEWAGRNFALNGLDLKQHQLLRADCLEWLEREQGAFDLVFLDPPTFSNSKKMEQVLDIQRDHGALIGHAMAVLAPGGTLVFSNNFRKFSMDEAVLQNWQVEAITEQTFDPDFQRDQKLHNCWLIRHPQ